MFSLLTFSSFYLIAQQVPREKNVNFFDRILCYDSCFRKFIGQNGKKYKLKTYQWQNMLKKESLILRKENVGFSEKSDL